MADNTVSNGRIQQGNTTAQRTRSNITKKGIFHIISFHY